MKPISYEDLTTYGALCERIGKTMALAIVATKLNRKKQAAQWWRAYYDATRVKERIIRSLLGTNKPKERKHGKARPHRR